MLWLSSFAVASDVVHGIRMTEGEEVGRHADNRTILDVKVQHFTVANAVEKHAGVGDARYGRELWAREFAKGVEENIVYATPYEVAKALDYGSDQSIF